VNTPVRTRTRIAPTTPPPAPAPHALAVIDGKVSVYCAHTSLQPIEGVIPNPRNPNGHPDKQIELLAKIILAQGWRNPVVVSNRSGFVIKGHGRLAAARKLGLTQVPVDFQDYINEASEWADMVADNRIAELSSMDEGDLSGLFSEIHDNFPAFDMELTGFTEEELPTFNPVDPAPSGGSTPTDAETTVALTTLASRFGVPPFSVLDARQGYWQDRKRTWLSIGIRSELGRGEALLSGGSDGFHLGGNYAGGAAPAGASKTGALLFGGGAQAGLNKLMKDKSRGRKANATVCGSPLPATNYKKSRARGTGTGKAIPGTAAKSAA